MLIAFLVGGVIGYLGGSAKVLIVWSVVGLALGWLSASYKAAAACGAIYGFALSYVFMLAGYDGTAPISTKLLPFVLFGLIGAVCGAVLATAGRALPRAAGK